MLTAVAAALAATLLLALLLPLGRIRLGRRVWLITALSISFVGWIVGFVAGTATPATHSPARLLAEAAVGAAAGFGLLNLGPTSWPRRIVAAAALPCLALVAVGVALVVPPASLPVGSVTSLLATGAGARTPGWGPIGLNRGPGYKGIARWTVPALPADDGGARPSPPTRATGVVGSVVIPGARSGFAARPAIVYLPPAALTAHPLRLPVVIALSGQSRGAGPLDVFAKGRIAAIMDGIAKRHGGVAPIVIVPDQLGPGSPNPMCVDSRLGDVATYLTTDVRDWALTHLPVATDRADWTIAGFSEGGTCAIQFGAGRPDLFGSLVDISGEEAPRNGTLAHTVAVGFGSVQAYAAASPFHLLSTHRYRDTEAFFAAGALDHRYGPVAVQMAAHAARAGMTVRTRTIAHLAHTWVTAGIGLRWGLDSLTSFWPAERTDAKIEAGVRSRP
jgi:hypothetical protein